MIEIDLPDGSVAEFPDGTPDEDIERAIQQAFPPSQNSEFDAATLAKARKFLQPTDQGPAFKAFAERNPIASKAATFLSGLPYIGEAADEGLGKVAGGLGLQDSGTATDAIRSMVANEREVNPKTAAALQVGGGLLGAGIGALAAGPAIIANAPASMAGKVLAGAGLGGVVGGTEGAVSGFGAGTGGVDDPSRMQSAKERGLIGTALGAGLGVAGPVFAKGAEKAVAPIARRIANSREAQNIAKRLGLSPAAKESITRTLPTDAAERLAKSGDDAMLADVVPGITDVAVQRQGMFGDAAQAIQKRATDAGKKLTQKMDDVLGPAVGVKKLAKDISTRTAPARKQAYDLAYSRPINYADDAGIAIEGVLDRVPKRTLKKAVREANEAMQAEGVRNKQIFIDIADNGTVKFREVPNVQQLDYLKRGLNTAGQGVDDLGRPTAEALRAQRLARDLRDSLGDAVPEYSQAVQLGGDKIAEDNALRLGNGLLSKRTTREAVVEGVQGMTEAERTMLKRGIRSNIDDTMADVKRALKDGNMEAREAAKLVKDLSSRANREKISLALGDDAAADLLGEIERATAAIDLRASVAQGSATQPRQVLTEAISDQVEPGALMTAAQGKPAESIKRLIQQATGQTPQNLQANRDQIFNEIANVLTTTRGKDAQNATAALLDLAKTDPIAAQIAKQLGITAGAASVGLSHQIGTQRLAR